MKANMKEVLQKNKWTWISFIAVLLIFFIYLQIQNVTEYPHDSKYYSETAAYIVGDGQKHSPDYYLEGYDGGFKINLLNYPETFRGYFWPTVVCLTRGACVLLFHDGYIGWRLIASFMCAITMVWALPVIFGKIFVSVKDFIRIIIMTGVVLIYWGDFLSYPLSDMAAFGFMCCGCAFLRIIEKGDRSLLRRLVYCFGAGFCFYSSYNTRAAYLIGMILAIVFFVYRYIKINNIKFAKQVCAIIVVVFIGELFVAAPQMLINHKYVGSYTPRVITEQWTNYEYGLGMFQIKSGMATARYETYIGNMDDYPDAPLTFVDEVGVEISNRERMNSSEYNGYGDYFKTLVKYPMDIMGIYLRHVISLMTPFFSQVYIKEIHTNKGLFISVAIWLWLISFLILQFRFAKRKMNINVLIWNLIIMVPMIIQAIGSPELRFFIGIYFLMYFYLFIYADYEGITNIVKKKRIDIVAVLFVIYFMWIAIVGSILADNEHSPMLFHDKNYECINGVSNDK